MPTIDFTFARHIALDETKFYYWDNENTNPTRNGLSWATAWRDGEGIVGNGVMSFIKATNTPYRMVWNAAAMSNDMIYGDCTGVDFERGWKKADFRASAVFSFTQYAQNVYSAPVVDVLTGGRFGQYGMDYEGHYIFAETLNYAGAWGVWQVTGSQFTEHVVPLVRVLNYNDLVHGSWYWNAGVMYIRWDTSFNPSEFEVIRQAKTIEIWTDTLPTDGYRTGVTGIRSRFGLFGHHNGACQGWRVSDSEFAWNAIDGFAIIAENIDAKTYGLYTQLYRNHIHHNYRDGITNYITPAGAFGRGNSAWFDLCADFNYIHDNGGSGVFLHRLLRVSSDVDVQNVNVPFRLNNNTIVNNGRGVSITDERMNDVIDNFGYDYMIATEWAPKTRQQKIDYWDSLLAAYDTAWVKLRGNNICNNGVNIDLITDTWPGTVFVIDSDYNNIFPNDLPGEWTEGSHSKFEDPEFTDCPIISGNSPLVNASQVGFVYPLNSEVHSFYFTPDGVPYKLNTTASGFNIGCSAFGMNRFDFVFSRRMPSVTIDTQMFQVLGGEENTTVAGRTSLITTEVVQVEPDDVITTGRTSLITTEIPSAEAELLIDYDGSGFIIKVSGVWKPITSIQILLMGEWKNVFEASILKDGVWYSVLFS